MTHTYNRRMIDIALAQEGLLATYAMRTCMGVIPARPLQPNEEFHLACQGSTWDEVAKKLHLPFPGDQSDNGSNQTPA